LETNAKSLVQVIKTIPRPRHLCFEEGTHSSWLYEVLSPHVDETVVTTVPQRRGNKDDDRDATDLANRLRTNSIEKRVYKDLGRFGKLRELARVHRMQTSDSVRIQNRIRALYRSRGIESDRGIFDPDQREAWIQKLPARTQSAAEFLMRQYDAMQPLRLESEKALVAESRKHPVSKVLRTVPGLGPIRCAELLPIVVTPHRFRTRQQFWSYAGLGIVMRSSSDWTQSKDGAWRRDMVAQTRGLNPNHNATLKCIFKAAALTVIQTANAECPLYRHYQSMLANKTKPNLAKVTVARQIAAIALAVWKKQEVFDPAKLRKPS
jgi:transposase